MHIPLPNQLHFQTIFNSISYQIQNTINQIGVLYYYLMGNALVCTLFPLTRSLRSRDPIKLIFCDQLETTRTLIPDRQKKKWVAGEIMFEYPECMVCPADSFFIGHRVPALGVHDKLIPGQTYFIIPMDRLAGFNNNNILSPSTLCSLSPQSRVIKFENQVNPFEYLKGGDGRVLIKVTPEFITRIIMGPEFDAGCGGGGKSTAGDTSPPRICTTPELKKRYDELVTRTKEHIWSPKLDTISEYKVRFSPCGFIGLEWKQKEGYV